MFDRDHHSAGRGSAEPDPDAGECLANLVITFACAFAAVAAGIYLHSWAGGIFFWLVLMMWKRKEIREENNEEG